MKAQLSAVWILGLAGIAPGAAFAASLELTPVTIRVLDSRRPPARHVVKPAKPIVPEEAPVVAESVPVIAPTALLTAGADANLDQDLDQKINAKGSAVQIVDTKPDTSLDSKLDAGAPSSDQITVQAAAPIPEWKLKRVQDNKIQTRPTASGVPGLIELEGPQELGVRSGPTPSFDGDVGELRQIESRYRMSQAPKR